MVIIEEITSSESSNTFQTRSSLAKKLFDLAEARDYEITQVNGQRIFAPRAALKVPPPPKGCEVFIGKLPRNCYEDQLIPVFERIGPLYKFRLMLDFHEKTRGFAFATYFTKKDADFAVRQMDGYELWRGWCIGVFKSVDNRRLFVGNIPLEITKLELWDLVESYVEGVVDVIMYNDNFRPEFNRGFAFIEFENHRLAAMARRQFTPENLVAWGQALYVDWADPLPEVHPRIMAKVTILYLKNLPVDFSSEEMYTVVCNAVGSRLVKKVHKIQHYAFVHFFNRRFAEIAFEKLNGLVLADENNNKQVVEVEWSKPRRFSKKNRLCNPPQNFCKSVPPNMRRMVLQNMADLTYNSGGSHTDSQYNSFASQVPSASSPYYDYAQNVNFSFLV